MKTTAPDGLKEGFVLEGQFPNGLWVPLQLNYSKKMYDYCIDGQLTILAVPELHEKLIIAARFCRVRFRKVRISYNGIEKLAEFKSGEKDPYVGPCWELPRKSDRLEMLYDAAREILKDNPKALRQLDLIESKLEFAEEEGRAISGSDE